VDIEPATAFEWVAVLLVVSAFFAASEAGLLGTSLPRLRNLAEKGGWTARTALWMVRRRSLLLTVTLVGITASLYFAERLATEAALRWNNVLGPVVVAVAMTLVVLVFCEAIPIQLAARAPEAVVMRGAPILAVVSAVLSPVLAVLWALSRSLLWLMGVRRGQIEHRVSEEHLRAIIDVGTAQGVLGEQERLMLHRILDFEDLTAGQVMTPRTELVTVDADTPLGEALQLGLESGHSRLPVFRETIDNVVGIFHLKDSVQLARRGDLAGRVGDLAREAAFVPDSLPADVLLQRLQAARRTAAIVKDEYGGTAGLVTLEDLLEELVGAIQDEYDTGEQPEVQEIAPGEWSCDGGANLHAVEEVTGVQMPEGPWDTMAGFILSLAEQVPAEGDVVEWGPFEFTVAAMDDTRIERVLLRRKKPSAAVEGGEDAARG
jgi:CBS domain containing-hemolysin-like protein